MDTLGQAIDRAIRGPGETASAAIMLLGILLHVAAIIILIS